MIGELTSASPTWIQQVAEVLRDAGIYGFAVLVLVALAVFWRDPKLRYAFMAIFGIAFLICVVVIFFPPSTVRIVKGTLGDFAIDAEPYASSSDRRFYVAHRNDKISTSVDWILLIEGAASASGDLSFTFLEKIPKKTTVLIDGIVTHKVESAQNGGVFQIPSEYLLTKGSTAGDAFSFKLERYVDNGGKVCFSGSPLKAPICQKELASRGGPEPVRHGSLSLPAWLWNGLVASATAQQPTKLLEGIALESALLSTDPVSIAAASREIEKNPERQADLINRVLGRSGDPSPYSARLAISIALRQYYRDKSLVFPSADGNWLSDASWQRILLDSFDRSDVLGDTARRTLRILKSAEAKAVIDTTLPKVAGAGGSDFATCLDLLKQDIFVNWAALSFENLKKSGQFAPAQWKSLGGLLDEVTLSSSATKQNAHRLRANFVKGAILLEAAQSLPADARMDLQAEGLDELRKIQKAIQEIGLPTAKSTYPVNPAELDKTQAFLERFDKTKSLDLQILTQETAGPLKPYPNCKIS